MERQKGKGTEPKEGSRRSQRGFRVLGKTPSRKKDQSGGTCETQRGEGKGGEKEFRIAHRDRTGEERRARGSKKGGAGGGGKQEKGPGFLKRASALAKRGRNRPEGKRSVRRKGGNQRAPYLRGGGSFRLYAVLLKDR